MTSSLIRGRPRRATSHISVRLVHTLLGLLAGVAWLVLPWMTINSGAPVPVTCANPGAASAAGAEQGGTSAADLVLPLVAVGAAVVFAGYGYVRRTRRARTRTTPGGTAVLAGPAVPPLSEADERARASLVEADDCVRTSREELGFAEARFEAAAVEPFARAVRDAESELAAAFRMRQQYDDGVPEDEASRRHALAGIVGRCQEAGRRLDAEATGFDRLRALEGDGLDGALEPAEARFRELAGRTGAVDAIPAGLGERYGRSAAGTVTGYVEQAKDRLVFATTRFNQARQRADMGDGEGAARHLRAAEGATAQAAVFVTCVERLAADLTAAAALVPAALTGAEAELAAARATSARGLPVGELHARAAHADVVLAAVREELTAGPYDPLDALRRITRAIAPVAVGRAGVLSAAALLAARSALAAADGFVTTHRGAVGSKARTRLAEAERLLTMEPPDALAADARARQAHDVAEQDVRVRGNPIADAAGHATGAAGAVLGGILRGTAPDGGSPVSYGGPHTRARRAKQPG
ncbi:hypothetical protein [Streptomyces sp. NBC_00847]|uniref:hypothetical protein n=1 Tax=Streptomyces sp. NBC_00847 TaxID=2975850 RepID=UPI002259521A|nr:hypothetical protein [Streptomyces sp. NBC_00847]MCX4883354.1 hypothetical protein [Streptomyces sp. NBC_00847]